jgi:hypothetical protein
MERQGKGSVSSSVGAGLALITDGEVKRGGTEPPNTSPTSGSFPASTLPLLYNHLQLNEKLSRIQKSDVFVECYLLILEEEEELEVRTHRGIKT